MNGIWRVMIVCAAALAVSSPPAQASSIELSGGTAGSIPDGSVNDFIPSLFPGPQIGGYYGATLLIDVPVSSALVVDFFGAEAQWVNSFSLFATTLFTHSGGMVIAPDLSSPLGSFSMSFVGTGVLPFGFSVDGGAGSVANGSNPDDSAGAAAGPNFFASCDPFGTALGSGGVTCSSVYLFLDDGGAFSDDNHDDFLVRISVRPAVPEPSTLALLSLGLLGLARRRFSLGRR